MKRRFNTFDPQNCRRAWICYLDLLGFKKLVRRDIVGAVHRYYQARETVEDWIRRNPPLQLDCWSDSFVIHSLDDSPASFWRIEQAARFIMNENLLRHVPIRGALACGAAYVVREDSIFIGEPLIEAYEHAENQDWIGFLLCRSATRRLGELNLPPSRRLNYRRRKIPWRKVLPGQKPLHAYLIGASSSTRGRNDHLRILHDMMAEAEGGKEKGKYRKTIEFLNAAEP
jgi:hypothetical protein